MTRDFLLPDVGEGLEEAEVVQWHVAVGDQVVEDQLLVAIETAKSIVEISSPFDGVIEALGGDVGQAIEVGRLLVRFADNETSSSEVTTAATTPAAELLEAQSTETEAPTAPSPVTTVGRVKAAPVVRRIAAERGVDLTAVAATGPGGRVTRADLDAHAPDGERPATAADVTAPASASVARQRPPSRAGETIPLRGLRREVARNMVQSWTSIPHVFDFREVDAGALLEFQQTYAARPDPQRRIGPLPFVVKAVASALAKHPFLNSSINEDEQTIQLHSRVDIGIATSTPDGLLVPVVRGCDSLSIGELAEEIARVVGLARTRSAKLEELRDGTYTVNNLGALDAIGALQSTPLIRPPESGILGFGRIHDRVVARDGQAVVRPTMFVTSVADHRMVDGDGLLAFTDTVVRYLQDPVLLLEELR